MRLRRPGRGLQQMSDSLRYRDLGRRLNLSSIKSNGKQVCVIGRLRRGFGSPLTVDGLLKNTSLHGLFLFPARSTLQTKTRLLQPLLRSATEAQKIRNDQQLMRGESADHVPAQMPKFPVFTPLTSISRQHILLIAPSAADRPRASTQKVRITDLMNAKTRIAVVGLGYVGMSLGVLLARTRNVVALDIDEGHVAWVNGGHPIFAAQNAP